VLDEASARLAAIVESSDDAIISKTLGGIVTSWNAAATRLFGYEPAEIIGRPILLLIPPDLQHEEADIIDKVRRGERVHHYETRRVRKDGSFVEVSLTVSPVRDADGNTIGASKIARDIGVLKVAQAERDRLLESERTARGEAERLGFLKDEFLATLSHELRTPLNAILGWCALLREPSFRASNQKQAVETIERNARAQAQIIDDLLDMSRIISGKIALEVAPMRLEETVRAAVEALRPAASTKDVRLSLRVEGDALFIRGDTARIQQVCWNLMTNALKFTPAGGLIEVLVRESGGLVSVIVRDTGIGIRREFVPYVFDRFRQADSGTTRRYGGLGLGLSIVRTLTELHGGAVIADSEGEGHGATFTVSFPSLSADQLAPRVLRRGTEGESLPSLENSHVLVVDDDADSRALLARVLEERGAQVTQAGGAQEALAALEGRRVDVVLSDIGMPGMDGYQFMRQVRALGAGDIARVPAIAVSAYAREDDRRKSIEAGYQAHIAKPYAIGLILEAVRGVLDAAPNRN
jgi:PAS domain S-box-containing protein